jgi:hypothetical protein
MTIHALCSHCGAGFNLADALLNKQVRCLNCSAIYIVKIGTEDDWTNTDKVARRNPATEAQRPTTVVTAPAPRHGQEVVTEKAPLPGSGSAPSSKLLIVLSAVAGGLLLLGLGGMIVFLFLAPPTSLPAPQTKPRGQPTDPGKPNPNGPDKRPVDPSATVAWQSAVDPPSHRVGEPADAKKTIPALDSAEVFFPPRPSPFVSIGSNNAAGDSREIWNLESMEKVGTLKGRLSLSNPIILSPDGKFLAGRAVAQGPGTFIDVVATDNKEKVHRIIVDPDPVTLVFFEFAGPNQMVSVKSTPRANLIQVWNLNTPWPKEQINLATLPLDAGAYAVSPGGRFLALLDQGRLSVYDLRQAKKVGERPAPPNQGRPASTPKTLEFSPDGVELAVLFEMPDGCPEVLVRDLATGEATKTHHLSNLRKLLPTAALYPGPALAWMPDRSGWLLYGFFLVDAVSGATVWTAPVNPELGAPGLRRVLSPKHLAMVAGVGPARKVRVLELPRDEIDQAVKAARMGQRPDLPQNPPIKPVGPGHWDER